MYNIITGEGEILAKVKSTSLADVCVKQIIEDAYTNNISVPKLIIRNEDTLEYYRKIDGNPVLEELDLSVRSYNCLKRAGIKYASDIMDKSITDISKIRNLGPKCTKEVLEKICDLLCIKI